MRPMSVTPAGAKFFSAKLSEATPRSCNGRHILNIYHFTADGLVVGGDRDRNHDESGLPPRNRCPKPIVVVGIGPKADCRARPHRGNGRAAIPKAATTATWSSSASFEAKERNRRGGPAYFDHCAYYATDNNALQEHRGVVVIDASDPRQSTADHVSGRPRDARPARDAEAQRSAQAPCGRPKRRAGVCRL